MFDFLFSAGGMVVMPAWIALAAAPWLKRGKTAIWTITGLLAYGALWIGRPLGAAVRELERRNRPLMRFGCVLFVALAAAWVAELIDGRTLNGVGVWVKPMKFMASVGLYAWTTAWLLGELPPTLRQGQWARAIVAVVIVAGAGEIAYITFQGALGQPSHFNSSTPFHAVMYALMGLGALAITACALPLAWLIARHGSGMAPAYRLGAVLGLILTFAGGAGAGIAISLNGGPTVGAMPGGAVVPLFGWSMTGGDLRVAHFLGVHAQQVLPAVGMWTAMAGARARVPATAGAGAHVAAGAVSWDVAAVGLAALAYAGLTAVAGLQAAAGVPLLLP
ncbi:MAG: hypothetical protein QHC78_16155 [Pigmentiphaga sp.]|uniref:hypothetical protein n=1 Tax=Pigmentiphaga sp. TaxID=1977564 RepID=UPI0029A7995E|nr:hypothetical protein [Pigmentiphaga sp.]MDX3907223.1 hypothetical protein [Pigmentiphaga sp.]